MHVELLQLCDDSKDDIRPADWHSLFHELIVGGGRLKVDEHDIEDRQKHLEDSPEDVDEFMAYAFRLCQTDVGVFQSEHDADEAEIAHSAHAIAWLAANRLLGSLWQPPGEEESDNPTVNGGNPDEENGNSNLNENDGNPGEENGNSSLNKNGGNPDNDNELSEEGMEQVNKCMTRFLRMCLLKFRIQRRITTKHVLATACNTDDYDVQHSKGISTASRTDYLLASFEVSTGFMKCMNAIELWSIVRKKSILELAIPWTQEELKAWDITATKGFPTVEKLTAATKTKDNDTGKLKAIWDNRHKTRFLLDPDLRAAASNAPRCQHKHFLVVLNEGRQLHSDFAHAYPLLSKQLLKNLMIKEFESDGGADFKKKWESFKARIINSLRSAATQKKQSAAAEEAKRIADEAAELKQQQDELDAQLKAVEQANTDVCTTRQGTRKRSQEELALIKEKSNIEKQVNKRLRSSKEVSKTAEQAEAEAQEIEREAEAAAAAEEKNAKKAKQKKKPMISLIDLTEDSDEEQPVPPARDTAKKNATNYIAPNKGFQRKASHIANLLISLRLFVGELAIQEEIKIDFGELKVEEEKAMAAAVVASSEAALTQINKAISGGKELTAGTMQTILRNFATEGLQEEGYVNCFVRRAFVRLGMLNVTEFCKPGSQQPLLSKVLPRNIVSSLKSWMGEYSDRKMLYSMIRIIEQLQTKKHLGVLKKHIKSNAFNCSEKNTVASIVDLITKKDGVEKRAYHNKKAKAAAAK